MDLPLACRLPTIEEYARTWPDLRGSIQPDPRNTPQTTKKAARIIEHIMGDETAGTDDDRFWRRVVPHRTM